MFLLKSGATAMQATNVSVIALAVIEMLEARAVDSAIVDMALIMATAVLAADLSASESELRSRLRSLQTVLTVCANERFRTQPPFRCNRRNFS
jgi:hypothetical protein